HGGRPEEEGAGPGHRVDLREAGPGDGSARPEEVVHLGVRLLGDQSQAGGLGQDDLSQAVRDRDQLPADEPVPDPDDDEEVQRTVLLRGDRVAAAEPVGMAASRRPVDPAAGVPAVQLGAAAGGADAAVAGACGRGLIWSGPHGSDRKIYTSVGCDLTPRDRSLGKY